MSATFDDNLLHAWLDGELPPEARAEVDAWLAEQPDDAARVRLWAADGQALREHFDPVLGEAVPQALTQVVWRKAPQTLAMPGQGGLRWAALLAVFVLGGAAGACLIWRMQPTPGEALGRADEPAWVQRAAVAHAVYVPEVRHPVEVKAQEEHLSRWLTKRLDVPVKLFDLRAQGFELVGGRLLPDATGPSAQLMYEAVDVKGSGASGAGPAPKPVRVTVYLRKPDSATPAAFRYEQQGEVGLFYWVEGRSAQGGPCGYALVGALPREQLLALAEAIYKQGPGEPP